jgi:hypothetical protein
VYLQTLFRLGDELKYKLVTNIEALRVNFPGTAANSVVDKDETKHRASMSALGSSVPVTLGDGIGVPYNRVPLTKESLDLMDTPVPSGVLAETFAYHGLAPSFLRELHQAHELLDEIYTEVKKYLPNPNELLMSRASQTRRNCICAEFQMAYVTR